MNGRFSSNCGRECQAARSPSSPIESPGRALRTLLHRAGPRSLVDLALRTGPHRLSLRTLRRHPHGLDLGPLEQRLPGLLQTADKRINLVPDAYRKDLERLRTRRARLEDKFPLRLIGRRHLRSNNSWMHNSWRLVKGRPRCTLLIHPEDGLRFGLVDGASALLESETHAGEVVVEFADAMMRGVVSLPHGWGHHRPGTKLRVASEHAGISMNDFTNDRGRRRAFGNRSAQRCSRGRLPEIICGHYQRDSKGLAGASPSLK